MYVQKYAVFYNHNSKDIFQKLQQEGNFCLQ